MRGTSRRTTRWSKLLTTWKKLQLSYYGGKYSVHRLLALETYTRTASLSRAFLACIWTPLPTVAVVCLLESLPLRDPRDGWQASPGFWIRVAAVTFVIAQTSTGEAVYFIDSFKISARQLALLSAGVAGVFTGCSKVISATTIFPVPFSTLVLTPVYNIIHIIMFRVILGAHVLRQLLAQRRQLMQYMNFLHAQIMMLFVYPIYEVLFRFVEGTNYQLPVILLLPLMKVVIKNIVLRCTMHVEDMTPELVIFTVDFFNAIYVATCMQSATSALAISAIVMTDLSQTIIMLYGLHRRTRDIISRLRGSVPGMENRDDLLSATSLLCRDRTIIGRHFRQSINIFTNFPHRLPTQDDILLKTLHATRQMRQPPEGLSSPTVPDIQPSVNFANCCCSCIIKNRVQPTVIVRTDETRVPESLTALVEEPSFLRYSLETFFTIECLVVASYLETIIPLLYAAYILVMSHLPSVQYHSEMAGVTPKNAGHTVLPVFVFGLLQVVSFALLVVVIKRNCGMQALYQLAFVLETHRWSIMSKLMVWMLITLSFRVVHFGA